MVQLVGCLPEMHDPQNHMKLDAVVYIYNLVSWMMEA